MSKRILGVFCALALALVPGVSSAMRCQGGLVQVGATKVEVLAKCGEPLNREDTGERLLGGRTIYTERWTYDMGAGKFMQLLDFAGGVLETISNGSRR